MRQGAGRSRTPGGAAGWRNIPRILGGILVAACLGATLALAAETPNPGSTVNPTTANASQPQTMLPPLFVTAARLPQAPWQTAASIDEISADDLANSPSLTIDDTLRAIAAFSLFRRSGSLLANPTAQGVSLRGLGPSGASRSLVLLDGIPLNDPFGGWVAWSKVPRLTLDHAEIVRGGGSGVWGNAALGGTIQLFTSPSSARGDALALEAGEFETLRGEFVTSVAAGAASAWDVGGRWFRTDGTMQYARNQRGPIDRSLDSEHKLAHAGFRTTLDSGLRFTAGGQWFDEDRGNGTPFQRNDSRETAAHARLAGEVRPGFALDVLAYAQGQHFASGFSSVDDARTSETPALDQFDVPATAWGGAVLATLGEYPSALTSLGIDARAVSGETREDYLFSNGAFQRRRFAGGDQWIAGAFVAHERTLAPNLTAQIAARVDRWRNFGGHRREWNKADSAVLRDEHYADQSGTEFDPSAGLAWHPTEALTWRTSVYRAFRVPTLNELYRPFRVGDVATEANPDLHPESVTGVEAGLQFQHAAWRGRTNVFQNELHDGVANVTLSTTPGLTQRQRLNLDAIRVRGFEANLAWNADERFGLMLDFLLVDARVREARVAPDLVGRRLAQVPRHTLTLQGTWRPSAAWRLDATARAVSRQFEDDANTLPLAAAATFDVALRHTLQSNSEVSLTCENLFDTRVQTGRTAGGLVSLAPGRWVRVGWTQRW